ncbi:MAG TPA: lytic murein transglycosylase [Solirubrobacteraceae bacterium]|jgi:soluble lytic murein transglycosylase-like protein
MSDASGRANVPFIVRRAIFTALAGGGLTAAGIGGPLAGGALGAEAPVVPPAETPTTTESAAPTQTSTTTTSTTSTGTTTTATPVGAPSATTTQPTSTATTPVPGPPKAADRHAQQVTSEPATTTTSTAAAAVNAAPATPKSSAAITAAPQLAAVQSGAFAAMMTGATASAQALDFYRIPLFLLPIYQAAAVQYGVPWQILAAINEVETNFGTDLSVSTAGAVGWMQFMPETWLQYGVDALGAGYADPYNPVDAIFAAARYLHAAGASTNLRGAILAYNHSEAYAESVLLRARLFSSYPASVIATLTGLTEGSLPVAGAQLSASSIIPTGVTPTGASSPTVGASSTQATAPAPQVAAAAAGSATGAPLPGSTPAPSPAVSAARAEQAMNAPSPPSQLSELLGPKNAPVVAVEDGRVVGIGASRKLGDYVVLRDTYGDVFTYSGLGSLAPSYRLPKPAQLQVPKGALPSGETGADPTPTQAATAGRQSPLTLHVVKKKEAAPVSKQANGLPLGASSGAPAPTGKVRVFAHAGNPDAIAAKSARARLAPLKQNGWLTLGRGSVLAQGTVLGHLGSGGGGPEAGLGFAIRPAGATSAIDPRPILANWRQLDAALHPRGAKVGRVLAGATADDAFLLSQGELERAVLADPGIELGACDRGQVAAGKVSREALALLVYLSRSGLKPAVGELVCGRAVSTSRGLVTVFPATGTLDIAAINGVPIAAHQGVGTVTDVTIRTLLTLKHRYAPQRIISLMRYPGAPTTVAEPDHSTFIQIALPGKARARGASGTAGPSIARSAVATRSSTSTLLTNVALDTVEWQRLVSRLGTLQQPKVSRKPSASSIRDAPPVQPAGGTGAPSHP